MRAKYLTIHTFTVFLYCLDTKQVHIYSFISLLRIDPSEFLPHHVIKDPIVFPIKILQLLQGFLLHWRLLPALGSTQTLLHLALPNSFAPQHFAAIKALCGVEVEVVLINQVGQVQKGFHFVQFSPRTPDECVAMDNMDLISWKMSQPPEN